MTRERGGAHGPSRRPPVGLVQQATGLLGQALASDDAEAAGMRADDVLADPETAVSLLGAPDSWQAARHAVVQRYGRVGALLVLGYEHRWRHRHQPGDDPLPETLEHLLEHFHELDAEALEALLAELDVVDGLTDDASAARRRLHATYAVAERDGTDTAHAAYMEALERVMRLAGPLLAS